MRDLPCADWRWSNCGASGLQQLVEVPDDGIGVERAAIMKFHAVTQLEYPFGLVRRIHLPGGGKAGDQRGWFVGAR